MRSMMIMVRVATRIIKAETAAIIGSMDSLAYIYMRTGSVTVEGIRIATVTAVRPPARFGRLELDGDRVARFDEKPLSGEAWINGAFFVLEPRVFDYIAGDATLFEREPLESLARDGQLMAYQHHGFWQCMDTMRDKVRLEALWASGDAPWKIWK